MDRQVIDHRGPEFAKLGKRVLEGMKTIVGCAGPVILFPSSGTGAWEAALSNTLSPGDRVLMVETGQFAALWKAMAVKLGLAPDFIETDWRAGADPAAIEARLRADTERAIKAVCVVHNETSTGCLTQIEEVRRAIDAADHPALLMVDTVSSVGSIDYRHDGWRVDVTVGGSQKGLMMPPGLSFNAVSAKALEASRGAGLKRAYWSWDEMIASNKGGYFPFTPPTSLLYGLAEAIDMLHEEGLENVYARHLRLAAAVRAAARAWGIEILCREPRHYSPSVTTLLMPEGHDADAFRALVLDRFDMSLGAGLGKIAGKVFRIGHLGDTNELTILGAISGVEMGLELAGVPYRKGGVQAAMGYLTEADARALAAE